jgi:hypothetical protein
LSAPSWRSAQAFDVNTAVNIVAETLSNTTFFAKTGWGLIAIGAGMLITTGAILFFVSMLN